MADSIHIRMARGRPEIDAALALRRDVFVDEQGIDAALESDGKDPDAAHAIAVVGAEVVGTARLLVEGSAGVIARVAVHSGYRRRGLAARLVRLLEQEAAARGVTRVTLHPHDDLEAYYAGLGYRTIPGSAYTVAHHHVLVMEKHLG